MPEDKLLITGMIRITAYQCYKARDKGYITCRTSKEGNRLRIKIHGRPKLTEEHKQKISKVRREYLKNNPDKVPYKLNHYSKRTSYAEKYFIDLIEKEKIDLKHHKNINVYELDFYNEEKMFYFEVDGDQHYLDKRIIESDKRRNEYLFNLGWFGVRIRWSTYQKLEYHQKEEIVKKLKMYLENPLRNISYIQLI